MFSPVKARAVAHATALLLYPLSCLLACLLAPPAVALPLNERELGRFVPTFGFVLGISGNRGEGHVNTGDVLGPRDPTPPANQDPALAQIVPGTPATERTNLMTPVFGASFELMTPALQAVAGRSIAGRPRLFGRVDVNYAFGADYFIPKVGDPGEFVAPTLNPPYTEGTLIGQGAETQVHVEPFVVTAGAGFAFTFEAWGRAVRLKPSVEYMRQEIAVSGLVRRAVALDNPVQAIDDFRAITLTAYDTQVYDFVGPGLEVDFDAARLGQMTFSPYLGLKAWAIIGNSKMYLSDTNEYGETAAFTFLPNEWAFGGTVGVRLRWAPE